MLLIRSVAAHVTWINLFVAMRFRNTVDKSCDFSVDDFPIEGRTTGPELKTREPNVIRAIAGNL